METIINKYLSSMLDELLEKALEEKPKNINIDKKYNRDTFEWKNLVIINEKTIYPIVKIIITNFIHDYDETFFYPILYTDKQKEMINKIFQKWSKDNGKQS